MNQHLAKAHDHFFRMAMADHRVAREFFEMHLPEELLKAIDLTCLTVEAADHIDDLRSEAITDMIFSTKIHGRLAYLKLIVEHQSTPKLLMPVRVQKYVCNSIEQHLKQNPGAKMIPLVIPIVLYHGKTPWEYSTDIRDLIDAPRALIDAYAFKPFILVDLNTFQDETLKAHLWSGVMELALKHIFAKNILPHVEDLLSLLHQLEQANGRSLVENVLIYILDRGEMDQDAFLSLVRTELPSEVGEKIMTVSEQLIAKGMEKGMHLAKVQAAHEMLVEGMDEAMVAKITKLGLDEIRAEALKLKKDSETHH